MISIDGTPPTAVDEEDGMVLACECVLNIPINEMHSPHGRHAFLHSPAKSVFEFGLDSGAIGATS